MSTGTTPRTGDARGGTAASGGSGGGGATDDAGTDRHLPSSRQSGDGAVEDGADIRPVQFYSWGTHPLFERQQRAAFVIQRAWRSFTNVRIYRYYRDLIAFKQKGNPAEILRAINPTEAALLDRALSGHIRFRLAGSSFPPVIVYKIFLHGAVVDLNAFGPRDYATERTVGVRGAGQWYEREERNTWRPIAPSILRGDAALEATVEPNLQHLQEKRLTFRPLRTQRREDRIKQLKARRRDWLRRVYSQRLESSGSAGTLDEFRSTTAAAAAAAATAAAADGGYAGASGGLTSGQTLSDDAHAEMLLEKALLGEEHDIGEQDLVAWARALDFEAYFQDWTLLATSGRSDRPLAWLPPELADDADDLDDSDGGDDIDDGYQRPADFSRSRPSGRVLSQMDTLRTSATKG